MARKKRRSPVHYTTFGFRDGSVTRCVARRKPSKKSIAEMDYQVDVDHVYCEYYHELDDVYEWSDELRGRTADVMANRLNTRRAIRELVLPELEAIKESLEELHKRIDLIEQQNLSASRQKQKSKPATR